jgi:hypothetical protein
VGLMAEIVSGRNDTALAATAESLSVQLELGVPGSLVPLARLTGTKLRRGQYLALDRRPSEPRHDRRYER